MADKTQEPEKKVMSRRGILKLGRDLSIGGLAAALYHPFDAAAQHMVDAYKSGKQIAKTLKQMGMGNEAQIELSRLEEQLSQAENLSAQYKLLHDNKLRTVDTLNEVYEKNETISRKAIRAARQIEMTLGHVGQAGEAAKPDAVKKLDDHIIDLTKDLADAAGIDFFNAKEARERHEMIKAYHGALREAYQNDSDIQQTVADFVKYLRTTSAAVKGQNKAIDENLPQVTEILKRNYSQVHALEDQGARITKEILPKIRELSDDVLDVHNNLKDDGVPVRDLDDGSSILDNTYTRHGLAALAGLLGARGAYAVAEGYVKSMAAPLLAVKKVFDGVYKRDKPSDSN